jgi:hypothetical protein
LKRLPFNVRGLAGIPKTQNPKGIALFLAAIVKMSKTDIPQQESLAQAMIERIIALHSTNSSYWCWGYSFPWQTRTVVVPRWAPNVVCTTFVAGALLDAYDRFHDPRCLDMAVSATEYMQNELLWTEGSAVGFSYPQPGVRSQIHNANLLAGALLCRVHEHTGEKKFLETALSVVRYAVSKQHEDGSWPYGESSTQGWVDNFHTGYNLCALRSIALHARTEEFDASLRRGFDFYRANFFRPEGAAKYFHDRTYPIDIHCVAQSIITLVTLRDLHPENLLLARSVFDWSMNHMWNDDGFFYYRVLRLCTIRTSYMRWSQAWMVLALSTLVAESQIQPCEPLRAASMASA